MGHGWYEFSEVVHVTGSGVQGCPLKEIEMLGGVNGAIAGVKGVGGGRWGDTHE